MLLDENLETNYWRTIYNWSRPLNCNLIVWICCCDWGRCIGLKRAKQCDAIWICTIAVRVTTLNLELISDTRCQINCSEWWVDQVWCQNWIASANLCNTDSVVNNVCTSSERCLRPSKSQSWFGSERCVFSQVSWGIRCSSDDGTVSFSWDKWVSINVSGDNFSVDTCTPRKREWCSSKSCHRDCATCCRRWLLIAVNEIRGVSVVTLSDCDEVTDNRGTTAVRWCPCYNNIVWIPNSSWFNRLSRHLSS